MEINNNTIEPFNQIPDEIVLHILQLATQDPAVSISKLLTINKRFAQFTADVQDVVLDKLAKKKHRTKFGLAIDHNALAWIKKYRKILDFNSDQVLPLAQAIWNNSDTNNTMKLIHYLVEQGAYIDNKYSGDSPLFVAFSRGLFEIAEYLIDNGSFIPSSERLRSPLSPLANCLYANSWHQKRQTALIKKLVKKGLSPFDEWWPDSGKTIIEKAKESRFNASMVAYFESLEQEKFKAEFPAEQQKTADQ